MIATFWILFIWMFVSCFIDIFRRPDVSGWGKAGWAFFMLIFPFFGCLISLGTRSNQTVS